MTDSNEDQNLNSTSDNYSMSPIMKITGVKINYYHICHTKLWLFSHNIALEHEHENYSMKTDIARIRRTSLSITQSVSTL
jgi:CRISPR-associated exonuclease Cas4